jgi:hypothetical protein
MKGDFALTSNLFLIGVDKMNYINILDIINTYSDDHPLKQLLSLNDLIFPGLYIDCFSNAILKVNRVDPRASEDLLDNKIRAKSGVSYNFHGLLSSLCELSVLNSFLLIKNNNEAFEYEPRPVKGSDKNPEFSIILSKNKYYVEVKSPNLENYMDKLHNILAEGRSVIRYDSRIFELSDEQKKENLVSTDSKVKDFLVDANKKFQKSRDKTYFNILFICWTDETDQPATGLKHPMHELLTDKSWYKDNKGKIIKFDNIDLIFISDLYQNHIVHMSCTSVPMPSIMSGVPYFGKMNRTGIYPDPFILRNSRNVIIESQIDESIIYPLPISNYEKAVTVITEDYVKKCCPEIKFSWK